MNSAHGYEYIDDTNTGKKKEKGAGGKCQIRGVLRQNSFILGG
jgi:hypothetical protein